MRPTLRHGQIGSTVLGITALATWVAVAQPDLNEQPLRENPRSKVVNNRPTKAEQRARREQQNKERRDKNIRNVLTQYGYAEAPLQDAVIARFDIGGKIDLEARSAGNELVKALRTRPVDETQVSILLANYRMVRTNARKQALEADKSLDAKVKYSSNVRLEAVLELLGAIGYERPFTKG
jgi:hypothetical protein